MTETEWLKRNAPKVMLAFIRRKRATDRQMRLYGCGCLRLAWECLSDPVGRQAVEVAERYVEGQATAEELADARSEAEQRVEQVGDFGLMLLLVAASWAATTGDVGMGAWVCSHNTRCVVPGGPFLRAQAGLLRCIFGNPFRPPPAVAPEWLAWDGGLVAHLAETIYEKRSFDHLPILGDALEDAGCTDADILEHCRSAGPHVRGCWVLDLLLGKG